MFVSSPRNERFANGHTYVQHHNDYPKSTDVRSMHSQEDGAGRPNVVLDQPFPPGSSAHKMPSDFALTM